MVWFGLYKIIWSYEVFPDFEQLLIIQALVEVNRYPINQGGQVEHKKHHLTAPKPSFNVQT